MGRHRRKQQIAQATSRNPHGPPKLSPAPLSVSLTSSLQEPLPGPWHKTLDSLLRGVLRLPLSISNLHPHTLDPYSGNTLAGIPPPRRETGDCKSQVIFLPVPLKTRYM